MILVMLVGGLLTGIAQESVRRVYDESLDRKAQMERALLQSQDDGRFVIAQVGGNWCKWCLRLAAFIDADPEIKQMIEDNFIYIHLNYNPNEEDKEKKAEGEALMDQLGNPNRFGFPVLVVMDPEGKVLHIQDSVFLESGEGYDRKKVLRFLKKWTPEAVKS